MEYNLVKLEELRKVTSPNDDDLILLSNIDTGTYQSTHMTVNDAFNSFNIRLDGAQRNVFATFRDTTCIDLDINEDSLRNQADANQAILDIFDTFGTHICELEARPTITVNINEPTEDLHNGDLWVDSEDLLYYWNGTEWTPITSSGGTVTILDTTPLEPDPGDLWVDSKDFEMYVWEGDAWVHLTGNGTTETGSNITLSALEPNAPNQSDLWVDVFDYSMYVWNGTSWEQVNKKYEKKDTFSSALPTDPQEGDFWIDQSDYSMFIWNGYSWVQVK